MSLIVSEVYDALIEAGASADKARAAAAAIPVVERLAREDLAGTIAETREDITEVRQDIARLEARLDKKIAVLNLAVFSFGPPYWVCLSSWFSSRRPDCQGLSQGHS